MPSLRNLSGQELVKTLSKAGFKPVRQKGSHLILVKETQQGKIGCVVPLHKELKIGTLKSILKQAKISVDEFIELSQ
jgi:predicted RNA binding protein YcfA (HicA-like mRNA interferase family)